MRNELIHKELSYKVVGILYDVYNTLGYGHKEKHYQRAIAAAFKSEKITFQEQVSYSINYKETNIGRYFLDFLVDDKIVLEIKKGPHFPKSHMDQILGYLKATELELAILACFTPTGVRTKRILNGKKYRK